jgi:hypothetical protein
VAESRLGLGGLAEGEVSSSELWRKEISSCSLATMDDRTGR